MKNFLLTVADLVLYTVAVMVVSALLPTADLSLPWWGAFVAPAVIYTLLVVLCCPRASTAQAIGIVALLFAAHAALASATGVVYAAVMALPFPAAFAVAAWEYLPAPLLQLFCVSLLVLPFRAMYAPRRARRRRSLSVALAGATDAGPRVEGFPVEETAPLRLPGPSVPALASTGPSSPSPISGGAPRGGERVEEVVSIPFSRIADQLPAGAFTIPPDRLGANMLEPGHLLVPTSIVMLQLADGAVSVSWDEVADQFPRHALAVNEAAVRDGLPEGRIVLPLDEIVLRLPPEMFAATTPAVDVQGIDRFPLPFRPFESETVEEVETPAPPPAATADVATPTAEVVDALTGPDLVAPEPLATADSAQETELAAPSDQFTEPAMSHAALEAEVSPDEATEFVPSFLYGESEIEYGLAPQAEFEEQLDAIEAASIEAAPVEPASAEAQDVLPPPEESPFVESLSMESPSVEAPAGEAPSVEAAAVPAAAPVEPPVFARPAVDAPRREPPRVVPNPVAAPRVPLPAPAPVEAPRPFVPLIEDRLRHSRNLAAVLTPFGALEVGSSSIEGVTLFTFNSSALPADSVMRTAASTLPFLMSGQAPWAIDQVTVHRERGAIILTPLGPVDSGGPVMVASVGRVGSLAMLELVCLKAAREHRLAYPAPPSRRGPPDRAGSDLQYETRDSGALPLGFLAGDLNAFGRVSPAVLRDSSGGAEVCVFLAPGEDSRAVAGFSVDVCRALTREGDEPSQGALQSVVFRLGERRLVVRPVKGTPGRFSVLVAVGQSVARPGLAHRQIERAAALLRAV